MNQRVLTFRMLVREWRFSRRGLGFAWSFLLSNGWRCEGEQKQQERRRRACDDVHGSLPLLSKND